jgi:hypothetical protein
MNDIVYKDLLGKILTESESQQLYGDIDKWRGELVLKLQYVDIQLTQRRAEFLAAKDPKKARIEYETWKKGAMGYKLAIVNRLSEIKMLIKQKNVISKDDEINLATEILAELRQIKSLLIDVVNR